MCWWELACHGSDTYSFKASIPAKSKISFRIRNLAHAVWRVTNFFWISWKIEFHHLILIIYRISRKLNCCIRIIKVHKMYSPLLYVCSVSHQIHYMEPGIIIITRLIRIVRQDQSLCCVRALWHFILPTRISQTMAIFFQCKLNISECRVHNVTRRIGSIIQQMKSWCNTLLALNFYSEANHIWLSISSRRWQHNSKIQYLHLNMSMMMQCSGKDATEYCNCYKREHPINIWTSIATIESVSR